MGWTQIVIHQKPRLYSYLQYSSSGKCSECSQGQPKSSLHACQIYGFSGCPACQISHFCLNLNPVTGISTKHPPIHQLIPTLLLGLLPLHLHSTSLHCHSDTSNKRCVLVGFSKAEVEPIRVALESLRDGNGRTAEIMTLYGLSGMEIEFVQASAFSRV
jgi:hypothetical protein